MARVDDEQPRPGNIAAFNRLLDADVAVARTFGLHVAQRGEALLQRPPRRNRGSCRAQRERRVQNVGVVAALRGIFALQKNVRVRIDQAGQHGVFRQIDHRRAGGNLRSRRVGDALDAIAANDDHLIVPRLVGLAVDQRAGTNDRHLRRRRSRLLRDRARSASVRDKSKSRCFMRSPSEPSRDLAAGLSPLS